eukprot:6477814-Amphidinium_carterae.1
MQAMGQDFDAQPDVPNTECDYSCSTSRAWKTEDQAHWSLLPLGSSCRVHDRKTELHILMMTSVPCVRSAARVARIRQVSM